MLDFFTSMAFLWVVVTIAAVICEADTSTRIAVWFAVSGVISAILDLLKVNVWIQVGAFVVISVALIALSKTVLKKYIPAVTPTDNRESPVGKSAVVIEAIDNKNATGTVKLGNLIWAARSEDDNTIISKDEAVIITGVSGTKLICK